MRRNQLTLPINTEMLIPKDDSVRLLDELTDQLDYSTILSMTSTTGVPAKYPPKLLFKILTYAYMNNIYSSRKIEKSCKRDINFMWLLEGKSAPDHNTINRFRNKLQEVIEDLFYQLVKLLGDNKEISYDNIFVDGTKLEANANKYSFVWRKSTLKHETRLQEKLKQLISVLNERYCTIFEITEEKVSVEEMEKVQNFLCKIKSEQNIEFVYGKGKRKHQIQRDMEEIGEMIEKQRKYDKYKGTFDGRNSFSKTDEDATFMHMKDDHMRNSQLKPGYNVQIGVEGEYIVGMDIFSERSDQLTLIPFLDKLEDNLPQKYKNIVADAGYESEENYVYLKRTKQTAYIKPSNYEKSKKRNYRKKINLRENMDYDEINDRYTCHNGKQLNFIGTSRRKSKSGYLSNIKIYECENCEGCIHKSKCTKSKYNRKIYVSEKFVSLRKESTENITSETGKELRMNRSIQVEGAFGVLKQDYGFRRFLTCGKKNVRTEFFLLCFGYNINKLNSKKINKRETVIIHELKNTA